jgi:hypothetical protein
MKSFKKGTIDEVIRMLTHLSEQQVRGMLRYIGWTRRDARRLVKVATWRKREVACNEPH